MAEKSDRWRYAQRLRHLAERHGRQGALFATSGLLLVACAAGTRSPPSAAGPEGEAVKIEVDAVSRATPRRLRRPLEITRISTLEALSFDPTLQESAVLTYELSKPAWVRIRYIGRRDPRLLLRTLVDWSPRSAGENSETWDGRDPSGQWMDRRICPGRFLIEGEAPEHDVHDRRRCGDPELVFESPRSGATVSGRVPVVVSLREPERGYLQDVGGSMRLHVDCRPVAEREVAPSELGPLALEWESTMGSGGSHRLTVNVEDGYDHVGTASIEVEVRNR